VGAIEITDFNVNTLTVERAKFVIQLVDALYASAMLLAVH